MPHSLDILFSRKFDISNSSNKEQTLEFSELITHAFSQNETARDVTVYAPFSSKYKGIGHTEYMEMHCTRNDASFDISLKILNSNTNDRRDKANDALIHALFNDTRFTDKDFRLIAITHISLGIQSLINNDCNVFTNAFLYLKWATGIDPELIKNYQALHKTMKHMVDRGVVTKNQKGHLSFLKFAVSWVEYFSKIIGNSQRHELDHPSSSALIRTVKYSFQETGIFLLTSAVRIANWILER